MTSPMKSYVMLSEVVPNLAYLGWSVGRGQPNKAW